MYISKEDLIKRLIVISKNDRSVFSSKTREELFDLYESYVSTGKRTYLNVPYKEKDIAKSLGARYDGESKKWYIPLGIDVKVFNKWIIENDSID